MSKSLYRLPFIAIALLMVSGVFMWASAKTDWDKKADERKAEYIFLEAQTAYSLEDYDKYVKLIERAYKLDSTDLDIAGEWAMLAMMEDNADSARIAKSYQLLTRRFRANPENFYNGALLARIAQQHMRYADALNIWLTLDSIYPTRPEVSQELAKAYLRNYITGDSTYSDNLDKALAIYDRMEQGAGRSLELTAAKIQAYFIKADTAAVINELDSLHAFAPKDSRIAQFIGSNYEYINKPDMAIKYYDMACELDSTNGSAYLQRAKFYNARGDSVGFDREVFMALKSQNLDVDSKIGILRSYVSELYTDPSQETRIRQLFDELQLMHSGEAEIHNLYGAYLFERKDYSGAAEQFSYSTALTPNDEELWQLYVQAAAMSENTERIEDAAKGAMEKFPDNLYFPIILSNVYRLNGEDQKAIDMLETIEIKEVRNTRAVSSFLANKADIYASIGDTIKALEIYDQAIDLNPDNSMALNNAAYFMTLSGGDLDKAERYSARSLQDDELNPTFLDTYAWVFFNKKDYAQAKIYIDIALNAYEISQNEAENAETAPEAEIEEDDTPVIEIVEEELPEEEPSADIYDHAGDIYFMNGEIDQAIDFWQKAHVLEPDNALIEKKVKHRTIFFK